MRRITRGLKSIGDSLTFVGHFAVLMPLLLYLAFKILVTIVYINTPTEPFTSFWAIFVEGLNGKDLAHYPDFLINIGTILSRLDFLFDVFILVVAEAMTIMLVFSLYRHSSIKLGEAFSDSVSKYPKLVAGAIFSSIFLFIAMSLPTLIIKGSLFTSSTKGALVSGIAGLLIQPLIIFIIPFIVLKNASPLSAFSKSVRMGLKNYIEGLTIVTVPFLISLPITLLEMKTTVIAFRLSPEFLIQLQFASELIEFISLYVLIGGTTILFSESIGGSEKRS